MTTPTAADGDKQPTDRTADLPAESPAETPAAPPADANETVPSTGTPELVIPAPTHTSTPTAYVAPVPAAATLDTSPATTASAAPVPPAPGQHAAPRPYPPVPPVSVRGAHTEASSLLPPPPGAPATGPGAQAAAVVPVHHTTPAAAAPTGPGDAATATATHPAAAERPAVPDLPRRPGAKRHLLGTVVGLIVTPVGLVLAAMGVGHMVDLPAGDGALTDVLGLVLLASGAVVLGLVALLGRWSPAAPITAGVVWGIAGGAVALWNPLGVHDAVHGVTDGRFAEVAVDHILDPALTGSLLVLGLVLLGSGVAAGLARGAGRSFGTRTVRTELARSRAERLEAAQPAETVRS